MKTVDEKLGNGNTIHYTIADNGVAIVSGITFENGDYYDYNVSEELVRILSGIVHDGHRYRFWYGMDGKVWNEYYDVSGYVGLSGGRFKVPLLLKNKASIGGGMLSGVMRIDRIDTRITIYQSPDFRLPEFRFEENKDDGTFRVFAVYETTCESVFYTNCKSKAERFIAFMTGKRYAP